MAFHPNPVSVKPSGFYHGFALLGLLAILAADQCVKGVTITPPLVLVVAGYLALKMRPRALFFWAIGYSAAAIYMIYLDRVNWAVEARDVRFVIRLVWVVAGSGVALGLCFYRTQLENSYLQLRSIMEKIPIPFVVSDDSGNIISVNDEAARICNASIAEMTGDSYFKYFGIGKTKGDSIRRYMEAIQNPQGGTLYTEVWLSVQNRLVPGSLVSARFGHSDATNWILTMLSEEKKGEQSRIE